MGGSEFGASNIRPVWVRDAHLSVTTTEGVEVPTDMLGTAQDNDPLVVTLEPSGAAPEVSFRSTVGAVVDMLAAQGQPEELFMGGDVVVVHPPLSDLVRILRAAGVGDMSLSDTLGSYNELLRSTTITASTAADLVLRSALAASLGPSTSGVGARTLVAAHTVTLLTDAAREQRGTAIVRAAELEAELAGYDPTISVVGVTSREAATAAFAGLFNADEASELVELTEIRPDLEAAEDAAADRLRAASTRLENVISEADTAAGPRHRDARKRRRRETGSVRRRGVLTRTVLGSDTRAAHLSEREAELDATFDQMDKVISAEHAAHIGPSQRAFRAAQRSFTQVSADAIAVRGRILELEAARRAATEASDAVTAAWAGRVEEHNKMIRSSLAANIAQHRAVAEQVGVDVTGVAEVLTAVLRTPITVEL